eukprot:scaffold19473_cov61-Attheya_sp.AAC.1
MISSEEAAAPTAAAAAAASTSASASNINTSAAAATTSSVLTHTHTPTAIVEDTHDNAEESEVASPSRSLPLQKRRPRDEEHGTEEDAAAAAAVAFVGTSTDMHMHMDVDVDVDVKPALLHPVALGGVDLHVHVHDASASAAAAVSITTKQEPLPYPFLAEEPPAKRSRGDSTSNACVSFNDMVYELLKFRAATGNCLVPVKKGGALGRLGFTWDLGRSDLEAIWSARLQELEAFKAENSHCNVSQNASALGRWLKVQREQYRETMDRRTGKPPSVTPEGRLRNALSQDRMDRLEALGVEWRINPPEVGWESRFQQLVEYRNLHGNCIVPQGYKDNRQLGRWVMKQRTQYTLKQRGEHTQLSDQRVQMLESIGFVWYPSLLRTKSKEEPIGTPDISGKHRAMIIYVLRQTVVMVASGHYNLY